MIKKKFKMVEKFDNYQKKIKMIQKFHFDPKIYGADDFSLGMGL